MRSLCRAHRLRGRRVQAHKVNHHHQLHTFKMCIVQCYLTVFNSIHQYLFHFSIILLWLYSILICFALVLLAPLSRAVLLWGGGSVIHFVCSYLIDGWPTSSKPTQSQGALQYNGKVRGYSAFSAYSVVMYFTVFIPFLCILLCIFSRKCLQCSPAQNFEDANPCQMNTSKLVILTFASN